MKSLYRLLEDPSITTSSKSTTNRSQSLAETPVQFAKGVGPALAAIMNRKDLFSVQDLLLFFPRTYEDRSQVVDISKLADGASATLQVRVVSKKLIPIRGRTLLEVTCANDSGVLQLKWFHSPRGIEHRLVSGAQIGVTGKVKIFRGQPEIIHPEISWLEGSSSISLQTSLKKKSENFNVLGLSTDPESAQWQGPGFGRMVPVYVEIEGVPNRSLRNVLWQALERFGEQLREDVPGYLLERWNLPRFAQSVKDLHFPPAEPEYTVEKLVSCQTPAHARLIYGEFFKFEYLMLRQRLSATRTLAVSYSAEYIPTFREVLPFRLTTAQDFVLGEILKDMGQLHPMSRLVQGDVGSGKTVVAFLAAATVVKAGGQAVLLVPTEILAEQHLKTARRLFEGALPVAVLTGKSTASERAVLRELFDAGSPVLLIGTHALLEDWVELKQLDLVIIDEQHRFGVEQRRIIKAKGIRKNSESEWVHPHFLMMSATPIPRTLALTAFGDLVISSIRELPPGRSPVKTFVVRDQAKRVQAYDAIRKQLQEGRQAYFIFPLVSESEAEGFTHLKSAVKEAEILAQRVFPEFKVGLLHGQMKNDEKASVMQRFSQGEVQILVSTTVVEVGVDVPNSTIMAVEHAERFGLSQLHQLRGRVGRGQHQSYCYLMTSAKADGLTAERLDVLAQTQDGFKIAEADLEIRGPGEFLGMRQSGGLPFKIANLVRDVDWLLKAREDAIAVLKEDPALEQLRHQALSIYYAQEGQRLQSC